MAKKKNFIYLYSKKVKITKLVNDFKAIPSFEIVKYLKNKEIYLPDYVHKALLRKNIAPIIAKADESDKFSAEMKYRLKWFDEFTIFQLERLAFGYQLKIDIDEYKKDFWDLIVRNRSELGINNLEFMKLQNLTLKYSDHKQETYQEMMEHFNEIYFEAEGYFDGSKTDKAKEVLNNATTLSEIRSLGKKYGVEIPRRITKKQLVDIVSIKLELSQEKEEELAKKSILDIERYAKRHDVNVSIELKKADMIEYILIKKPNKTEKKYANSMKVFKGMDVEEYLYTIKFEEIANRVKEHKYARIKRALIIFILITIIGVLGYYTLVTYIM